MLLFMSIALANSELENWAQGNFSCASFEDATRQRDLSVEQALAASNIVVRNIAASRLKDSPHICHNYSISTNNDTMTVVCDDKPVIDIKIDGSATTYPKNDGTTFQSVALVEGNRVTQNLQGENGQYLVIYVFSEKGLEVTKKISSPYLGKSIEVVIPYHKSN